MSYKTWYTDIWTQTTQTDHLEDIILWASKHFPCQTAEVSESALYKDFNGNSRQNILVKKHDPLCASEVWERLFKGAFNHTGLFHGREWMLTDSRVLHFTSMAHRLGISKAEENVCSCTVRQWSQRAPFHQNTGCSNCNWTMKEKKWLRWQTKIDLALLCAFSPPRPTVFNFQSSTRMEEVGKGYSWDRGRREGWCGGGV